MTTLKNAIGGIALIAGTAIGAAILALPVATAHLGFIQTIAVYCICWFFMTMAALYLLETNLMVGYDTNLISMAQKTLGIPGKYFTWVVYLILLYALLAAYISGAGAWVEHVAQMLKIPVKPFECALLATLFTMLVIFLGTAVTDRVNRLLMVGLISAFACMIWISFGHIHFNYLITQPHVFDLRPIPLIITAFGSAIVIPTLTSYLHGKPRQLFNVVFLGSLIPLAVYIIWELTIVGLIPLSGNPGLLQIQQHELQQFESDDLRNLITDIPMALKVHLDHPWITAASSYFSIFALITSLLGVCLSLFDFLADGLKIKKTMQGKLHLSILTFAPPLLFALLYPRGFSIALSFAGIFVALLLGILPALMVWRGRYQLQLKGPLHIVGGKAFILITVLFFVTVIGIECSNQYETHMHQRTPDLATMSVE